MSTNLASIRTQKGLSQAKLGAISDIHPATISALEHQKRPAWPALRRRISQALEVNDSELFDSEGWPLTGIRGGIAR